MKNLKTQFLSYFALLLCATSFAQQQAGGHITLLRKNAALVYLGAGSNNPNSDTQSTGAVKGLNLNLDVYKPIWIWDKSNISLGINAGGSYFSGNGDYSGLDDRYMVYNLQGQSQPPTVTQRGNNPKGQGFKFGAGPQLNIHLGNLTLSPIFTAAYLSTTTKALTVSEKLYYNGSEYDYDLLTQKENKTNGMGFIPKLRLAYNITPRIGVWLEGSYLMGPTITTESTRLVLDPTIPADQYNLAHFQDGQYITTKKETKYNAMGINGGIVIGLGKPNNEASNSTDMNRPPHGRHTCLICGRKHRGICKFGLSDNLEVAEFQKLIGDGKKGLYDGEKDNCEAKSGIACVDEISVSNTYDLTKLNEVIATNNEERIKNHIIQSNLRSQIGESIKKPETNKLISLLEKGLLTLEIVKTSNPNISHYLIKTPSSYSEASSKSHNYVGHVTLLR